MNRLRDEAGTMADARPISEAYLGCMQSLIAEIERSVSAISQNALHSLEESVAAQVALCGRLSDLKIRCETELGGSAATVEPKLVARIDSARGTLLGLNRRYAALLKHQGETVQLFQTFVDSCNGNTYLPATQRADFRTWSCHL